MARLLSLHWRKWFVWTRKAFNFFQPPAQARARFIVVRAGFHSTIILLFAMIAPLHAEPPASITPTNTPSDITNAASPSATEGPTAYKKMSLEELMNLDVTSVSRTPQPFGEAPAAIVVITSDEIRRSGASSIPEALRLADNLAVAQRNSHDWAISARGFNSQFSDKLLVMIDGRTVYSPIFSGVFWNVQDYLLQDIDRIEVISGPGGTLWGANAVNGVINIITKSAKDTQGLYLEGGGGTELRDLAGVRYGATLASNVYLRVYGKWFQRGNEVYPDVSPANDSWQMGQGGFRMDADATPNDTVTFQGDVYGSNLEVPAGGLGDQSGGNLLSRWSHVVSDDADMSLQLYYDQTHLLSPQTFESATGPLPTEFVRDDLRTYDMDFQYRVHLGERNQVTWGTGYRFTHDEVGESEILRFVPATLDRHLYSAFVQDQIMLMEKLYFTLGTKLEHNDYTGFEVEPSGRLQFNVTSNQMLWSAVSRAVRTPSRFDTDLREGAPGTPALLTGTPGFESEALIAYELGYRAQLTPKLSTSISTYFNDYTELRSLGITPGGLGGVLPLHWENDLTGHTYGAEASLTYQVLEDWRLHAGYNAIQEHIHVRSGGFDFFNALDETADPKNQVFLRNSFDLPANMEFDDQLRYVDKLIVNNPNANGTPAEVPSYFEMDARLAWHPTRRLEIAIVGQNLLHDRHAEFGIPTTAPGGQEQIVRSVYGKVSWKW